MVAKKECHKDSEITSLQLQTQIMADNIKEIKTDIRDIKESIHTLWDKFTNALTSHSKESDTKYATKEDHHNNKERLERIESILAKVNWLILSTVILAVVALIIKIK